MELSPEERAVTLEICESIWEDRAIDTVTAYTIARWHQSPNNEISVYTHTGQIRPELLDDIDYELKQPYDFHTIAALNAFKRHVQEHLGE